MFLSLVDTLEDVMQASIPSFIQSVKVSDLRQGDNAMRIISIRHLPDTPENLRENELKDGESMAGRIESQDDLKWGHYVVRHRIV
jgi:hypothetical protein